MGKICHYFFLLKGHDKIHHYILYKIGAKMPLWQALNININKDKDMYKYVVQQGVHNNESEIVNAGQIDNQ